MHDHDASVESLGKLIQTSQSVEVGLVGNVFVFSESKSKWPVYKPEPRFHLTWTHASTSGPWARLPDEFTGAFTRVDNIRPMGVYQRDYASGSVYRFLRRMLLGARISELANRLRDNPYGSIISMCGNLKFNHIRLRFDGFAGGFKLYSDGQVLINNTAVSKVGLRLDANGIVDDPMDWTVAISDHRVSARLRAFPIRSFWDEFAKLSQIKIHVLDVKPL